MKHFLFRLLLMSVAVGVIAPVDVNNAFKEITVASSKKIPYVGFLVGFVIDKLWPSTGEDIWSSIEKKVSNVVDKGILEYELQERNSEINAIRNNLEMYKNAKKIEKRGFLTTLIVKCDTLYEHIIESKNNFHTAIVLLTLAHIELSVLKERYEFGSEIYNENNKQVWLDDLIQKEKKYSYDLEKLYKDWQKWRRSKISAEAWVKEHPMALPPFFNWKAMGTVEDPLSGKTMKYSKGSASLNMFKEIVETTKELMFREAKAEYMESFQSMFSLHQFKPGYEEIPPIASEELGTLLFGPYRYNTVFKKTSAHESSTFSEVTWDEKSLGKGTGNITKVKVGEWNIIDGIQVLYQHFNGTFMGNKRGGKKHEIVVPENSHITKVSMKFAPRHNELVSINIFFANGEESGWLGNRGKWRKLQEFSVGVPNSKEFQLVSIVGPQSRSSIPQLSFCFKLASLMNPSINGNGPFGIVTGGLNTDTAVRRSVELLDPTNNKQCQLPDLPNERYRHTQNGNILCGGYPTIETKKTCIRFQDGEWIVSNQLIHPRYEHRSWTNKYGQVLLIGGRGAAKSTEKLTSDGRSQESFNLEYGSVDSCLINEGTTFLLTGGYTSKRKVSRYDDNGRIQDLDDLKTGRWGHGCTQYNNDVGEKVNLVCGGGAGAGIQLNTCEKNIYGQDTWAKMTSLPERRFGVRALTIGNTVFMIGGFDGQKYQKNIFKLEAKGEEWKDEGAMYYDRQYLEVSSTNENLWQYCT